MPTTMVWIYNNQLNTRRKYGSICAQQWLQRTGSLPTAAA